MPGSLNGWERVAPDAAADPPSANVTGYDGKLSFSSAVSPDGHQLTITASSPVLANRDYRCTDDYELDAYRYSSAANPNSSYSGECGCWSVSETLDQVPDGGGTVWFSGFAPTPPKPAQTKLSRSDALYYMKAAVRKRFSAHPLHLTLTRCSHVNPTTWSCASTWRDHKYRYLGTERVWIGRAGWYWYYSFNVRRTKLRCSHACTKRIIVK